MPSFFGTAAIHRSFRTNPILKTKSEQSRRGREEDDDLEAEIDRNSTGYRRGGEGDGGRGSKPFLGQGSSQSFRYLRRSFASRRQLRRSSSHPHCKECGLGFRRQYAM